MPNETMSCFLDTNLLVYGVDPREVDKRQLMKDFLRRTINRHTLVLSPQTLNELYRVITEKRDLMPRNEAQLFVWSWTQFCTAPYDFDVTQRAWQLQDRYGYRWWDCVLLASATIASCDLFLSEDLQHGQMIGDLKIVNPFRIDPTSLFHQ
jgi:predicted nucleic acid-binding protein